MTVAHAAGIDLGTSNTVTAVVNASGHTEVLRDSEGQWLVPSIVLFDDERIVVGEEARLRGRTRADRLAACAKRDLGHPLYHQRIGGGFLPPEFIQACVLRHIRQYLLHRTGQEHGAVIAVPAAFNDLQRRATAEAAEMAGLSLLGVISETLAGALALGENTRLFTGDQLRADGLRVLVLNMGGWATEVSLVQIGDDGFRVLQTESDTRLGGNDWDHWLAVFLAKEVLTRHGVDLRKTPEGLSELHLAAGIAKRSLTLRKESRVNLAHGSDKFEVTVSRDAFFSGTTPLVARVDQLCETVLAQAHLSWSKLAHVMLVGGASQMPALKCLVRQHTGKDPEAWVHPEEAIARGTAIYGAHLLKSPLGVGGTRPVAVTNISTHSLGVESVDPLTGQRVHSVMIPKGSTLPATATREFVASVSAQRTVAMTILDGESEEPARCVIIGRAVLREVPADVADRWPVEVTFQFASSGAIKVDARMRYTDRTVHLTLARAGDMSKTHVARWKKVLDSGGGFAQVNSAIASEKADRAPPAVIIATAPPLAPPEPEPAILAFAKRCLPFAFGRPADAPLEAPAASSESGDGHLILNPRADIAPCEGVPNC